MQTQDSYWGRFWKTRVSRRSVMKGAVLGAGGLAAAAVVGCGDDEETTSGTPTPSGAAVDQPKRGGTIYQFTQINHAPTLDMHMSTFAQPGGHGVYGRLAQHDLDKYPGEIAFTGDVAENWEFPDAATWIFHLRPGLKYHNIPPVNGRVVKASDVVYSFDRQKANVNGGTLRAVTKTEAVDDSTIKVTLTQPDADILWALSDYRTVVMPSEAVESAGGELKEGPIIGTGAWIWDQQGYVLNQVAKLKRNPDYFRKGADGQALPYADSVEQVVIVDANLQVAAFRAGQTDLMDTNGQTTELLKQTVPDLYVLDAKLLNQTGDRLWMDATVAPYTDVRVRQALGKLFNREEILANAFFGSGWVNPMMFVPSLDWLLPQAEFDKLVGYNPQESKQLLQAAGVDTGSFKPSFPSGANFARNISISEILAAEMNKIGIKAEIQPIVSQEVIDVFTSAKAPIALLNDPAPRGTNLHLFNYFHSKGGVATYWKKLGDTEFDRLIEAQSTIVDSPERRKAALLDVVRRGLSDAVAVPSVGQTQEFAIRPRVANYKHDSQEPHRFAQVWLKS